MCTLLDAFNGNIFKLFTIVFERAPLMKQFAQVAEFIHNSGTGMAW